MMNKKELYTAAIIGFYAIVAIYAIVCTIDAIEIITTIGGLSMMPIKPTFSVSSLIRDDRRYSETHPSRLYAGLHTPAYRVLNHVSKTLLKAGLYGACTTMMERSQYKHISYKSLFSVTIAHGYSSVTIGARTIFAIDEWTRTIYHIDASGRLATTDYYQDYDMSDVISQVSEAIEVLKQCYKPDTTEVVEEAPREWVLKEVLADRPYHRDFSNVATCTVTANLIAPSKKSVAWAVEWYDRNDPSTTRIERGFWFTAYKVEILDVVAWLPHSLLGGLDNTPFMNGTKKTARLEVPVWWFNKNIAPKMPMPF
jgi:hypothetical protein